MSVGLVVGVILGLTVGDTVGVLVGVEVGATNPRQGRDSATPATTHSCCSSVVARQRPKSLSKNVALMCETVVVES